VLIAADPLLTLKKTLFQVLLFGLKLGPVQKAAKLPASEERKILGSSFQPLHW